MADPNAVVVQGSATGTSLPVTASLAFPGAGTVLGATQDAGPLQPGSFGVSSAAVSSADMTTAANVTDVPTSGQKLVITDIICSCDTAMRLDFQEETSGTVVVSVYLAANTPCQLTPRGRLKLATANKRLQGHASVAGGVRITVFYYSEA